MVNVIGGRNDSATATPVLKSSKTPPTHSASAGAAQPVQQVTVSNKARLTQQVAQAARASEGVDAGKVAQVQKSIDEGSYVVLPGAVAQALAAASKGSQP